jgi:hypothetical protein
MPLNPALETPNIATIMAKKLLWPLVVIAGLSLANPSKAALGWTWDECQQHWGQPLLSETDSDGQFTATFEAHDLQIMVWLTDGKVARVAYQGLNHEFSESDLLTFQKANAISPAASWVLSSKDEGTQNYHWQLREEPNKTDAIAGAIFMVKENAFIVFTAADNQRAKNAGTEKASGL